MIDRSDVTTGPMVRQAAVKAAAALLIAARRKGQPLEDLPDACAPQNPKEAFAIQDVVRASLGPTTGWKVGAPCPQAEPTFAPLLASLVTASPANLQARRFHMVGIEIELAFRLGRDLAPSERPHEMDELRQATASVHAAIEVVDSRLPDWQAAGPLWRLADNQTNGFFILGTGTADWRDKDLAALPVRLRIDGATAIERIGGNSAGDPFRLFARLADHCCHQRGGLKAGDVITTGTCTGLRFITAPSIIDAEFAGIGRVALTLAD